MVHIKDRRGLDLPLAGKPSGDVQLLPRPSKVALNFSAFPLSHPRLLVQVGQEVAIGEPLAEDKNHPTCRWVSPGCGIVEEIRRGPKRVLTDIVIALSKEEKHYPRTPFNLAAATQEELAAFLQDAGLFTHLRSRPFNVLARPNTFPRSIFIKAVDTAPFAVPAELHVQGYEKEFEVGLQALTRLSCGHVHLVYSFKSRCSSFLEAKNVLHHTVDGPHPLGNTSIHIHHIDPIQGPEDIIWTVTARDVVVIGMMLTKGHYHVEQVISVAGTGVVQQARRFYRGRLGHAVADLLHERTAPGSVRYISGDVLTGAKVESSDFLHFGHTALAAIPEGQKREFAHFFRLGTDKYTATRAYLSGHRQEETREYVMTTSQHGEERAFVEGSLYDKVMPMQLSTIHLVKAILADDYDDAENLGVLEVDSEDFALPTFICPSKIEMSEIVKKGLLKFAGELLS